MDAATAWTHVGSVDVAVLSTIRRDGSPRSVPCVFGVTPDRWLVTAVDHKPKSTRALGRLADIQADPRVTMLFHSYSGDWSQLWWVRIDGAATVVGDPGAPARAALVDRYVQYRDVPPEGPWILIEPLEVVSWAGGGTAER
jgi:PPOX class probable F420-dependent enzyme